MPWIEIPSIRFLGSWILAINTLTKPCLKKPINSGIALSLFFNLNQNRIPYFHEPNPQCQPININLNMRIIPQVNEARNKEIVVVCSEFLISFSIATPLSFRTSVVNYTHSGTLRGILRLNYELFINFRTLFTYNF